MTNSRSLLRLLVCAAAVAGTAAAQSTHYSYTVQTVAGSWRSGDGGPATSALIEPISVAAGAGGTVFIGDERGRVRRVAADGVITTLADLGTAILDVVPEPSGTILVSTGLEILRISSGGQSTKIAGGGMSIGEGARATQTLLLAAAIAVDRSGKVYYAEPVTNRVRVIGTDGIVRTIAGTGESSSTGDGGPASAATLSSPAGVAVDAAGNIYIAEEARIRRIDAAGTITTIAGTGRFASGGDGGPAINAPVVPDNVAVDAAGNVYFAENLFDVVRRVSTTGTMVLVAGTGDSGFAGDGGSATSARLDTPFDVTADADGNVYIADWGNARVRRVNSGMIISTFAGAAHFQGDGGAATTAVMRAPRHAVYDAAGNLYVADYMNRRVRRVSPAGTMQTFAGNGEYGPKPDGVAATNTAVGSVNVLTFDAEGNVMLGGLGAVRRIDRAGVIGTFAGSTSDIGNSGDGGTATAARFFTVDGLTWDKDGNLYIADAMNHRIRKVAVNGTVSTHAGSGRYDQTGDGGPATAAAIASPTSLAFDRAGNLYVVSDGTQVRKITPQGVISTILEEGVGVPLDHIARASNAVTLPSIDSVAIDSSDTLYFTFPGGVGAWRDGMVWRVAGAASAGFGGDGGLALNASFGRTLRLSAGPGRTLVIADEDNHRVRTLTVHEPRQIEITGGNNQTAAAGSRLAAALAVRVAGAGAVPAPLVPVSFVVSSGSGTLSSATVLTDGAGTAAVTLTLGEAAGPVKVRATVAGLTRVEFTATATASSSGPPAPRISEGGITGAALSVPPVRSVATNGIATVWGENFLPAGTERRLTGADLVDGRVPTNLGGICVQFGTALAPIFAVFPSQINVQVPSVAAGSTVEVRVIRNCGAADEVRSAPMTVTAAAAAPEFFSIGPRVDGRAAVAARHAETNMIVGPEGAFGEPSAPARPGSVVTIYATGFGATSPAFAPGELPGAAAPPVGAVEVSLGGVALSRQDVLYAGVTPGSAGLYQVNIKVPEGAPDGELPVTISVGGVASPAGGYLLVRR